jgi:hypothetical protein
VYATRFDGRGVLRNGWFLIAPGYFASLAVADRGGGQELFGIGLNQSVYAAALDADGALEAGWFNAAPGLFTGLDAFVLGNGDVGVIGRGFNDYLYGARFSQATGMIAAGWYTLTDTTYTTVRARTHEAGGTLALAIAGDGRVHSGLFDADGNVLSGFVATAPALFDHLALAP